MSLEINFDKSFQLLDAEAIMIALIKTLAKTRSVSIPARKRLAQETKFARLLVMPLDVSQVSPIFNFSF